MAGPPTLENAPQHITCTAVVTAYSSQAESQTETLMPCSPEFDVELAAAYAPHYRGTAAWNGLHARDGWYSFARTCHDTALSHCVHPEVALTHTDPFVVEGAERATGKDIRSGISASALVRRGLRQPTHGRHGRPRETAQHRRPRWVADLRNPTARDHLWHLASRLVYTNAPSAVVHLIMSLRSSHLVGDHLFYFEATAVASAYSLCQERVFPSCQDFGSAPRAHSDREHRWRHIEHLLFECPGILGTGGTLAVTLLRDDLFKEWFGSDHASAVLLAAFPSDRTPVVAATACLVPFLLDPAAALGCPPPWRMKFQCLSLVAAFLLGASAAACTRLRPSESVLASLRLPAWSSVHSWFSAYGLVPCLPRRCSLHLLLFCTCPPLCAGALRPMPAWVWHDGRLFLFFLDEHRIQGLTVAWCSVSRAEQSQGGQRRQPSACAYACGHMSNCSL